MQSVVGDAVFQQILALVQTKLGDVLHRRVDLKKVADIVKSVMEKIDEISSALKQPLSGERKAQLAADLIKRILNDAAAAGYLDGALRDKLVSALDSLGPVMFQLIVSASKGDFDLAHIKEDAKACKCW